ncbi:MAG: hypothetical protein AAGC55_07985, partial [Myxococcota bacterium]
REITLQWRQQRGSVVIVAMLAMVALISLGGLTTLAVRGGLASSGHDRFKSIALYAAESGAAAAMDFLRSRVSDTKGWTDYLPAQADPPPDPTDPPTSSPDGIIGNNKQSGEDGNPFSDELRAWYRVEIYNNRDDPDDSSDPVGNLIIDDDFRVVIRSTGFGPGGAVAQVEVEINAADRQTVRSDCAYSQEGESADNAGACSQAPLNSPSEQASYDPTP